MAVFRVNKNKDFTVMSNRHFKERRMSLKAKGLLSLMLSLPESWDYSINGLTALSKDGKDSVMNGLQELRDFRYLKSTRQVDENGRFAGYAYDVFEEPYEENPDSEKPYPGKPNTEKPNSENPPQLNTKESSTKEVRTKESSTKEYGADKPPVRFTPPTLEEVKAYCQERQNEVDPEKFVDFYSSKGWMVGKNKMKDWRAAVRTWERKDGEKSGQPASNSPKTKLYGNYI